MRSNILHLEIKARQPLCLSFLHRFLHGGHQLQGSLSEAATAKPGGAASPSRPAVSREQGPPADRIGSTLRTLVLPHIAGKTSAGRLEAALTPCTALNALSIHRLQRHSWNRTKRPGPIVTFGLRLARGILRSCPRLQLLKVEHCHREEAAGIMLAIRGARRNGHPIRVLCLPGHDASMELKTGDRCDGTAGRSTLPVVQELLAELEEAGVSVQMRGMQQWRRRASEHGKGEASAGPKKSKARSAPKKTPYAFDP